MDTKLGQISGIVKPREAESADTRYGLFAHPDDEYPRRHDHKGNEADLDFTQDEATVSTEALLLFLENYLLTRFGRVSDLREKETLSQEQAKPIGKNIEGLKTKAAKAVKAYENAAYVSHKVAQKNASQAQSSSKEQDADDVQLITNLIKDLRYLSDQNIEHLNIERGNSFLGSLSEAVLRAKQELPV